MANPVSSLLLRLFGRMRFPTLFVITSCLFLLDLVIPDAVPLVDELLLGLSALLLGAWRRRKEDRSLPPDSE